jgi:hypothetical protein
MDTGTDKQTPVAGAEATASIPPDWLAEFEATAQRTLRAYGVRYLSISPPGSAP